MMNRRYGTRVVAAVLLLAALVTLPTTLSAGGMSTGMRLVHPNPFTDNTTFELTMPRDGTVRIVVYNIRGAEVRVLVDNEFYHQGVWDIPWDGKDGTGASVPSGIYICVLFSDNTPVKSVKVIKAAGIAID